MNEQQTAAITRMQETLAALGKQLGALKHETGDAAIAARSRQVILAYRRAQAAWNDGWRDVFGGEPR